MFEIGKCFMEKLCRSHLTSLALPITVFIPNEIFNYFSSFVVGYHGDIKVINERNKVEIFLDQADGARKLFHPSRFDGSFFLFKRKFKKVLNGVTKKTIARYDGCAKVVVSLYTPMKFDYNTKTQRLVVSFFIQRYDKWTRHFKPLSTRKAQKKKMVGRVLSCRCLF